MKKYKTVRALLAHKSRWIKGYPALTRDDVLVEPEDSRACKFCLTGAVRHLYPRFRDRSKRLDILGKIRMCLPEGPHDIVCFNDHKKTKHKDILKVLKCAKV